MNDLYGHTTGDELLCGVSERLTAIVRPSDLVGRMGGDEFVAVLQETTSRQAQEIANCMITRLGEPFQLKAAPAVQIGVSIGGTSAEAHTVESVLEEADALLYAAKRAGKGTVRLSRTFSREDNISLDYQRSPSAFLQRRA